MPDGELLPQAFITIKYHPDLRNRALIEALSAALAANGYSTICVVRDVEQWGALSFSPAELMRRTFALIQQSAVLVVELSEKGVGAGIEAGYAHALGKPVWVVAQAGSDVSTTLAGIAAAVRVYSHPDELAGIFAGLSAASRP